MTPFCGLQTPALKVEGGSVPRERLQNVENVADYGHQYGDSEDLFKNALIFKSGIPNLVGEGAPYGWRAIAPYLVSRLAFGHGALQKKGD